MNTDGKSMVSAYMVDLEPLPLFRCARALLDIKTKVALKSRDQKTGREMDLDPDWPPASARVAGSGAAVCYRPGKRAAVDLWRVLNAKRIEPPVITDPARKGESETCSRFGRHSACERRGTWKHFDEGWAQCR